MIPRGAPDLSWSDLAAALGYTVRPGRAGPAQTAVESLWSPDPTLACLSV